MHAGTSLQPSLTPVQTMRSKAKSMLSLTAPSQMKRKSSVAFSERTSFSSSSIGSAPPTPTSPTHPASSDTHSDSNANVKPKKVRPGGGRRSYAAPSKGQNHIRTTSSMTELPILDPATNPKVPKSKIKTGGGRRTYASPSKSHPIRPTLSLTALPLLKPATDSHADTKVPKLKIKTGGGRRHMAVLKQEPAPPELTPVHKEAEVLNVRVSSPSPPVSPIWGPSSPIPSSSSPHQTPHTLPTPVTPTRRIRIPPAPRIPPPPVPTADLPPSPIELSPLHSPARVLQALPPSPSLSPSSPRRPFRALPSPPSPRAVPIQFSSSAPLPTAIRRLPSPPSSTLFSPLTPPSPLLLPLPLPRSFAPQPHELELLQSSSTSAYRNRRFSNISDVDTLPLYTTENPPSPARTSSSPSSPTGHGSPQMAAIGHPITRHGRHRHKRGSRIGRSPSILPTQIEEQEDGIDPNAAPTHMRESSTASDLLFYQENVMVPLFSGSPPSRPIHTRRRSASTPPCTGVSAPIRSPHQPPLDDDEGRLLRRRIKPLDTRKANTEYKLPRSDHANDDDEDSDVDPVVCESPGYKGNSERLGRQMARYQDRKARYEELLRT